MNAAACATAAVRLSASPPSDAFKGCGFRARRKARHPYTARKAAPASASARARPGLLFRACAMPMTPARISTASATAQKSTTHAHMLAAKALPQHKGVLRADGHNEPEAQKKTLDEDRQCEGQVG